MDAPWDLLNEDAACEIISRLTSIRDIINYSETSPRFYQLAKRCLTRLDSDEYIEVPLTWLSEFKNLRVTGENIRVLVTPRTLHLVESLPRLLEANFILEDLSFESFLDELNLNRKVPQESFRMINNYETGYIIQGNRWTNFGVGSPIPQEEYPGLYLIDRFSLMREICPDYLSGIYIQFMYLISPVLGDYLLRTDFGLVDPSQPPSEESQENLPLNSYLQRVVQGGLIDMVFMLALMRIYFYYRRQANRGYIIDPEFINFWGGRSGRIDRVGLERRIAKIVARYPNRRNLSQYNAPLWSVGGLPGVISPEEYRGLYDLLQRNLQFYEQGGPFYTTQGDIR